MKYFVIFSLFFIGLSSCETPVCCEPESAPFVAAIYTSEGKDYLAQHADDSIQLYYFRNNEKVYLNPNIGVFRDTVYLSEPSLLIPAGDGRDFYLQVDNDVDTLFIYRGEESEEIESVLFNGEIAEKITAPRSSPYFYLIKE